MQPSVDHVFHSNAHHLVGPRTPLKSHLSHNTLAMELPELKRLEITSEISIEPVTGRIPNPGYQFRYLIMGPTGAGKSSFIKSLAGECQQLSISKNQLAGYTQSINAYCVMNINYSSIYPVHLIDTPGFSDSKISKVEIINMVRKWLKENDLGCIHKILFLTPITEARLPGSRRKTIAMLKQLLAPGSNQHTVTFVTTLWDTLHNERTRKLAESTFEQLRDQVCKDFCGWDSISITRFMNTKNSALEVLDASHHFAIDSISNPISPALPNFYQDLHECIEGALQEKRMIESELAQPTKLRDILKKNQMENHETLTKFISQLINFGPLPFGFHQAAQRLRWEIAAQVTPEDPRRVEIFQQWANELEILEEPVPDLEPSPSAESLPRASEKLAFKGLLCCLFNVSKDRESKWFKCRE